jgi:hypothetical protein
MAAARTRARWRLHVLWRNLSTDADRRCLVGNDALELIAAVEANYALLSMGVFERYPELFPPEQFTLEDFRSAAHPTTPFSYSSSRSS